MKKFRIAFFVLMCAIIIYFITLVVKVVTKDDHIIHDTETVTKCEREKVRVFHIKPKLKVNPYEVY